MDTNVVKVKHMPDCPICHKALKQDESNSLSGIPVPRGQKLCHVFICTSPLASNPLHYYTHSVKVEEPEWIISQEFSVDLGARYILFKNDYEQGMSTVKSSRDTHPLVIPILLTPDFPSLESLIKKIRMSITFS